MKRKKAMCVDKPTMCMDSRRRVYQHRKSHQEHSTAYSTAYSIAYSTTTTLEHTVWTHEDQLINIVNQFKGNSFRKTSYDTG